MSAAELGLDEAADRAAAAAAAKAVAEEAAVRETRARDAAAEARAEREALSTPPPWPGDVCIADLLNQLFAIGEGTYEDEPLFVIVFRDDPFVFSSPARVAEFVCILDKYREEKISVVAAPAKKQAYLPTTKLDPAKHAKVCELVERVTGVKVGVDGMLVLGAPVGTADYIRDYLYNKLDSYEVVERRLKMVDPTKGVTLLRTCFLPKANYLLRVIDPELVRLYAQAVDTKVLDIYNAQIGETSRLAMRPLQSLSSTEAMDFARLLTRD